MSQFGAFALAKVAVNVRAAVALTITCSTFVPSALTAIRRLPRLMPSMAAGVTVWRPAVMPTATYVWACWARLLALTSGAVGLRNGAAAFQVPVMSFELFRTSIWAIGAAGPGLTPI